MIVRTSSPPDAHEAVQQAFDNVESGKFPTRSRGGAPRWYVAEWPEQDVDTMTFPLDLLTT